MFFITHADPDWCSFIPISFFLSLNSSQALLILQLDAFVNRKTKQKTENTVTFSHFYQNEFDISENNHQSHNQC